MSIVKQIMLAQRDNVTLEQSRNVTLNDDRMGVKVAIKNQLLPLYEVFYHVSKRSR